MATFRVTHEGDSIITVREEFKKIRSNELMTRAREGADRLRPKEGEATEAETQVQPTGWRVKLADFVRRITS